MGRLFSRHPRRVWVDVCVALLIGVAGAAVALSYVSAQFVPDVPDEDTFRSLSAATAPYRDDLLYPCVRQFGFGPDPDALLRLPEWNALLTRRTDVFPCAALRGVPLVAVPYNFELHRNLHRMLSLVFLATGPRLIGIAWYQAMSCGLLLACLYGVFRLGMGRVVAAAVTLPLAVSPRNLEMALAPIEYAKAPFFAACLLGVGALVCLRLSSRAAGALALATGVVVGLGFGFKPDVLVYAPFGFIALALFYRAGPAAGSSARWSVVALYAAGVLVAGFPLLKTHFTGTSRSLLPIQVLGGMAPGFVETYAEPAIYDYGIQFDDDYAIAMINSYNQRVNGSREFGPFFSPTIQQGAIALVTRLERTFVADLVLRTYAAILQVLQGIPVGAIAALIVLIGLCRIDRRLAAFVLFTLVYMVGYVSLAFAPKHYFHLEFVPWWFAGCAVSQGARAIWRRRTVGVPPESNAAAPDTRSTAWPVVATACITVALVSWATLAIARSYQDVQVRRLVAGYAQPDRFERLPTRLAGASASTPLVIPEGVALGSGGAPATIDAAAAPAFLSPIVETAYLLLRLTCVSGRAGDLVAVYTSPKQWREAFTVPCERASQAWTVMWPIYQHPPSQLFQGFESPGPDVLRVDSVERARDLAPYPLLLRLRLPPDWSARPLHQTLKSGLLSDAREPVTPMVFPSEPPPLAPPAVSWDPPALNAATPLPMPLPDIGAWKAQDGVSVEASGDGTLVRGNDSVFGYQLVSPPVAVPAHAKISVRVFGTVEQGRVAVGILDGAGHRWLRPAVWGRSDFVADTETSTQVFIVFANVRQPADADLASRFRVRSVSYAVRGGVLDRLRSIVLPGR